MSICRRWCRRCTSWVLPGAGDVYVVGLADRAPWCGKWIGYSGLLVYAWVLEPILHTRLPDRLDKFFPMKVFGSLDTLPGAGDAGNADRPHGPPTPEQAVFPAFAYSLLFCLLAYVLLRVRDL